MGAMQQRKPETVGRAEDRQADEGAEHEERAMREAHHVHQAEDQRQARRDEKQQHAIDDAVQELGGKKLHARSETAPPACRAELGSGVLGGRGLHVLDACL